MKHLDSEYRNHWEDFYLSDGTVKDSRETNWRDVEWDKVERIVVNMKGKVHEFTKKGKRGFKGFMNFRWGGSIAQYGEDGKYIGHKPVHLWTIGWTNGKKHFLTDIDFHSGEIVKEYEEPYKVFINHVHDKIK